MATATPVIIAEVTLTLTAEEAWWLLGFLQNAHGDPHEEPATEEQMRGEIFDALKVGLHNVPKPRSH